MFILNYGLYIFMFRYEVIHLVLTLGFGMVMWVGELLILMAFFPLLGVCKLQFSRKAQLYQFKDNKPVVPNY